MAKGQQNGITIPLGIKGYEAGKVREGEEDFVVEVESLPKRGPCPRCGHTYIYSNGKGKIRKVLHSCSRGKKVYLELRRKRWRCRWCGHYFHEGTELLLSYSRITRQVEAEALWPLKDRSFSQVKRDLGLGYGTQRRLLEMEIDEEALGFIGGEEQIFLGIDEHSLRIFWAGITRDKVIEVCFDMKESLRKAAEGLFPEAKVVVSASIWLLIPVRG